MAAAAIIAGCRADNQGLSDCETERKCNRDNGIEQDAMRKEYDAEFGKDGESVQTLDMIAARYPNLTKLRISSRAHATYDFSGIQKYLRK